MATGHTGTLLRERRFAPFFWTQFLGAFNDNLFKNALIILIAFQGARWGADNQDVLINLAAGLFVLPFFLFSPVAGQLADKFEKSRLIRLIKLWEIAIMVLTAAGLMLQNLWFLLAVLFLLGAQSSLFGPLKYGILPQHLKDEELVAGNGLIEMGTFLAILLGIILGGILIERADSGPLLVSGTLLLLSGLGYLTARDVPRAAPVAPDLTINWNLFSEIGRTLRFTYGNRTVFLSIIGISWFWFFGAVMLAQFPAYTRNALGGNEYVGTLLLAAFSLGIGLGSILCDRMSGRRVELGLVPFGAIGISILAIDLFFATPVSLAQEALIGPAAFMATDHAWRLIIDIVLLGAFGGFYIVPLYALVQQRSEPSHRSRIIAGNNVLNSLAMVLAAGFAILLLGWAGLSIAELFLVLGLINVAVAVYIFTLVPEFLMRFLIWMLVNTIYRLRAEGLDHIPEEGPAVLVCNHVSYVDALIVAGSVRRPVRFVMYHRIFNIPVLKAGSKDQFRKVDLGYPLEAGELGRAQGVRAYILMSAIGASSSSSIFYNRVKGELEDALRDLDYPYLSIYHPSLLLGDRKEHRTAEALGIKAMPLVNSLLIGPLTKYQGIEASTVASAMVNEACSLASESVAEPMVQTREYEEIVRLAE